MTMNFNKANDLIEYITENYLYDVPVSAVFMADKKPKVDVWFGNFSFGEFGCAEDFRDKNPIAIVNWIDEKISLPEDEVDDYMTKHHYDSWLIPDKWKGMIAYAENYVEENNL